MWPTNRRIRSGVKCGCETISQPCVADDDRRRAVRVRRHRVAEEDQRFLGGVELGGVDADLRRLREALDAVLAVDAAKRSP